MLTRITLVLALVAGLLSIPAPAKAATVYDMVFPVVGAVQFDNTWGNARSGGRRHRGTDIMADKMLPVVAAADGVVDWVHDGGRKDCCALGIVHDDGWESWYIHLNNDTPGTDDGSGWGFAPGITEGSRVEAGQLIGWVGDSGNAEHTLPHVHFELHRPDGTAINPYHSLMAATPAAFPTIPGRDRADVAAELSAAVYPTGSTSVVLAPALTNALTPVVPGARPGLAPVLLTESTTISDATLAEIVRLKPTVILIVGGADVISDGVLASIQAVSTALAIRVNGPSLVNDVTTPVGAIPGPVR
ncbi:MAG: peptidoglycan DD-metalloendopeptidase family protein [Acidimicrobiia bacterium]|nr:peptidoglycan DD-metalloendopeptidase family protein [Acidimicrobiia bacterium]